MTDQAACALTNFIWQVYFSHVDFAAEELLMRKMALAYKLYNLSNL